MGSMFLSTFVLALAAYPYADGFSWGYRGQTRSGLLQPVASTKKLAPVDFYSTFEGHDVDDLESFVLPALRDSCNALIWCAGDSSLDNKYWLTDTANAPVGSGYENVLEPPRMKQDVTYWLNRVAVEERQDTKDKTDGSRQVRYSAINTAVEASTLEDRMKAMGLLPQDRLIRDHISPTDIPIVSIGANDVVFDLIHKADTVPTVYTLNNIFGARVEAYI